MVSIMYYVYVLYSIEQDKLYTGFTKDLKNRVKNHLKKNCYTTKRFGKVELVYYEACKSEKDARCRERQLKTGFGRGYLRKRIKNYIALIRQ